MKEENLIKQCKYYKGEQSICPPGEKAFFWKVERAWVMWMMSNDKLIETCLEEYSAAGLSSFYKNDDTPVTLKAVMFTRYCAIEERTDLEGFKKSYELY